MIVLVTAEDSHLSSFPSLQHATDVSSLFQNKNGQWCLGQTTRTQGTTANHVNSILLQMCLIKCPQNSLDEDSSTKGSIFQINLNNSVFYPDTALLSAVVTPFVQIKLCTYSEDVEWYTEIYYLKVFCTTSTLNMQFLHQWVSREDLKSSPSLGWGREAQNRDLQDPKCHRDSG